MLYAVLNLLICLISDSDTKSLADSGFHAISVFFTIMRLLSGMRIAPGHASVIEFML
jgi:hypothetical protein